MFGRTRYLDWALRFYGKVPFDAASSGIPLAPWSELGVPAPALDDPSGYDALRRAIAQYNDVGEAEVVPALGTSGALWIAYASTLGPGDEVLVEHPGYEPLERVAEGTGATVRRFERRQDEGFRIDPARVAAKVGPRTRVIAVTNLHNPSGVRLDVETLRELALVAEARGAYLLVDEVYAAFDDLPEGGVFGRSARAIAPNVLAVSSLTKCYGLGMHRIGWLLAPPEIVERAHAATIATTGHLPLSHANLGAAAFSGVGALARRAKAMLAGKRAIAERWAQSIPGARWSHPREGLFGLVTLPGEGDLLGAIERTAETAGVLVGAGSFFGAPRSFRVSWATLDAARFEEALARLDVLVRA